MRRRETVVRVVAIGRASVALLGSLALISVHASGARGMPAGPGTAPTVLVVGDSLAVGTEPFLGQLLGRRDVRWDARSGRTTPQGLLALRADLRDLMPQTVVVSLGTNDGSSPGRFASRARRLLRTVPSVACVVWPAIIRPPRKGAYHGLNRVLRDLARRDQRLTVPAWDRAVSRGSVVLPDGVHPDPTGFQYRSRMIAAAVNRGC
jgi:lysophospholipase L1-like esterase